jgi:hypothetical protein
MPYRSVAVLLLALATIVTLAAPSCVAYDSPECRVGADCPSGVCNGQGICVSAGSGGSSASSGASSSSGDAGICTPASNSVITHAEVPLQPGLHASFLSAENATVDTAGTMSADGSTAWDFSVMYAGDHSESVDTLPLSGQWFGKDYPGASYAARLSDSSDLLGVFAITDTDLELVGVASPTSGSGQTELMYAPAVVVLQFPLQNDATWSSTSMVTGVAEGVDVLYTETYQNSVDAFGTLKTPYASFNVLRVNTLLTRVVGALVTTTRTFSFVTACFGNVASVVSNSDEPTVDFTSAAVVSRLSP